jgi:hypothetical protein
LSLAGSARATIVDLAISIIVKSISASIAQICRATISPSRADHRNFGAADDENDEAQQP